MSCIRSMYRVRTYECTYASSTISRHSSAEKRLHCTECR